MPRFAGELEQRFRHSDQTGPHRLVDERLQLRQHIRLYERHTFDGGLNVNRQLLTQRPRQLRRKENVAECVRQNRRYRTDRGFLDPTRIVVTPRTATPNVSSASSYSNSTPSIHSLSTTDSVSSILDYTSTLGFYSSRTFGLFRGRKIFAFVFFLLSISAIPNEIKATPASRRHTTSHEYEQGEVILDHLNRPLSPLPKDRPHCPVTRPFLCPDSNICISLSYLCDDSPGDCPNNLDEDSQLCTAKKRFPVDDMEVFFETLGVGTVRPVFGAAAAEIAKNEGGYLEIANAIATSKTDVDFAKNIGMSQEDLNGLRVMEEALRKGSTDKLRKKNVPENIITDLRFFFKKLRLTGFFG